MCVYAHIYLHLCLRLCLCAFAYVLCGHLNPQKQNAYIYADYHYVGEGIIHNEYTQTHIESERDPSRINTIYSLKKGIYRM